MEKVQPSCRFHFGIDVDSVGSRGGLSLAWQGDANIMLQSFSNRHIDVIIEDVGDQKKWRFTGFYGSPYTHDRDDSWNLLRRLSNNEEYPWLVCKDFNEILYGFEKKRGLPRDERRMEAFRKTLEDCSLVDVGYLVFNENVGENFLPSRGLRQGDPLSMFLFLLCGEGLSSLMQLARTRNIIKGVKVSQSGPTISHLLFTDDCILFAEATERGAQLLKQVLNEYERSSGQCVNYDKSIVFFSSNTQERERVAVSNILRVRRSTDPKRYLGLPNMVERKKRSSFQNLKDRFKQRIDNWSIRYLSQEGKEVFIKAILQSIPTYTMACFQLPKTLCAELEGIIAKYRWQKKHNRKGIHWCAWKDLCLLKEDGGLGFRNLAKFNVELLAKPGWRLIKSPNSLLAYVLKAKYYPNSNFYKARLGNLPSLT
ncbi:uncharacterized protein [Gossypium hirsutum]|uniref:Reverse transcriptase domain-containing protein n=1 Tax=Gossypium hirsutum TaxID=3635 RepID=A0A1U8NWC0_GOSHI|nr:uncharacterized protein LOC107952415 [Gossypium hirsutum]